MLVETARSVPRVCRFPSREVYRCALLAARCAPTRDALHLLFFRMKEYVHLGNWLPEIKTARKVNVLEMKALIKTVTLIMALFFH